MGFAGRILERRLERFHQHCRTRMSRLAIRDCKPGRLGSHPVVLLGTRKLTVPERLYTVPLGLVYMGCFGTLLLALQLGSERQRFARTELGQMSECRSGSCTR